MLKILGVVMVAIPFVAIIVGQVCDCGWKVTALTWLIALVAAALIVGGIGLIVCM